MNVLLFIMVFKGLILTINLSKGIVNMSNKLIVCDYCKCVIQYKFRHMWILYLKLDILKAWSNF